MLLHAILLDASMSVSAALARLARHGLWLDPEQPAAKAWIAENARRSGIPFAEAAARLARDPVGVGVAIRGQWYANVLWYAREATEVLEKCKRARGATLRAAMSLREMDSQPPIPVSSLGAPQDAAGVVLDGGTLVAVNLPSGDGARLDEIVRRLPVRPRSAPHDLDLYKEVQLRPSRSLRSPRSEAPAAGAAPTEVQAWPRLDAPTYVPARTPFDVVVGLAEAQQAGVTGGRVTIPAPPGTTRIAVGVELIADGLDAPEGWTRSLEVSVANPTEAVVSFRLVGRDPAEAEGVHLTMLEVRYVLDGAVCGTAARPLVVGRASARALSLPDHYGTPWVGQPAASSPLDLRRDEDAADLTIELAKPDGNPTTGRYVCTLISRHPLTVPRGPFQVDLGDEAKTFAKNVVGEVRLLAGNPIVDHAVRSIGELVAEKLPPEAFAALREVAQRVAPAPPAVLIASADPYVPWELAFLDPPLDPGRPPFLGAQALVGRWLRERRPAESAPGAASPAKPPVNPPSKIPVRHLAVMAGLYKAESGLRKLPQAEKEAELLVGDFGAIPLPASLQGLKQLLDATLERDSEPIGGADAVHFAGHGDFDPSRTDGSVLFLSDGMALPSLVFRSANYGGERQPLIFLNACMIGIGGELLGNAGGFPGNCLKGGFGGLLGALWEVDDVVAGEIALEFWHRALPAEGKTPAPVGEVLRDLRARYVVDNKSVPAATYLAYVYYGHPRLTLARVP